MAGTDYDMRQYINKINTLTRKIAQINQDILVGYAQTYARGKDYKNLLDERDSYLKELSGLLAFRMFLFLISADFQNISRPRATIPKVAPNILTSHLNKKIAKNLFYIIST